VVEAPDAAALAAARPDMAAVAALGARDGWLGVSAYALAEGPGGRLEARVRHLAPLLGRPADVVSGTAAAALGARLAAARPDGGPLALVVRHTGPGGRGGEAAVRVSGGAGEPVRVQVGGRVRPLLEGRFLGP
jgi:predicted PhzF superfamily epimerase YddE/YHI9